MASSDFDEYEILMGALEHTLTGVREYGEMYSVELRRDMKTGRLIVMAWNEGHNNTTQVDLWDLLDWLRVGPPDGRIEGGFMFPAVPKTVAPETEQNGYYPTADNQCT